MVFVYILYMLSIYLVYTDFIKGRLPYSLCIYLLYVPTNKSFSVEHDWLWLFCPLRPYDLPPLFFSCNCISVQLPLCIVSAAMVYRRRLRRRPHHQPFATHSIYIQRPQCHTKQTEFSYLTVRLDSYEPGPSTALSLS